MALLDKIKNQLESPTQGQAGISPTGGQTQTVRNLLQAKSGKAAAPSSGPRQSSLQEQVAESQAKAQQQQIGLRGRIQGQQLEQQELDIEQRGEQQGRQFQEELKNMQADFDRRSDALLTQFESGQKQLDTSRNLEDLEQLGFQLRLQNDQYINQLQDIGKRTRLDNQLEFKKQIAKNVFQDQQDILVNDIAFNRIIAADDREFAEELAQMDIGYAMQVADNASKARQTQAIAQGLGGVLTGGIQAYGAFNSNSSASPGASGEANPQQPLAMNTTGQPNTGGMA